MFQFRCSSAVGLIIWIAALVGVAAVLEPKGMAQLVSYIDAGIGVGARPHAA